MGAAGTTDAHAESTAFPNRELNEYREGCRSSQQSWLSARLIPEEGL